MPLESGVERCHASAAEFLRPQPSSLRDHQHRTGVRSQNEGHLLFANCVLLSALRFLPCAYCRLPTTFRIRDPGSERPPRVVAQGPQSGPGALPATRVLAAPQTGQSALGLAPRRIRFLRTSRPRRQNHGASAARTCLVGPRLFAPALAGTSVTGPRRQPREEQVVPSPDTYPSGLSV